MISKFTVCLITWLAVLLVLRACGDFVLPLIPPRPAFTTVYVLICFSFIQWWAAFARDVIDS